MKEAALTNPQIFLVVGVLFLAVVGAIALIVWATPIVQDWWQNQTIIHGAANLDRLKARHEKRVVHQREKAARQEAKELKNAIQKATSNLIESGYFSTTEERLARWFINRGYAVEERPAIVRPGSYNNGPTFIIKLQPSEAAVAKLIVE